MENLLCPLALPEKQEEQMACFPAKEELYLSSAVTGCPAQHVWHKWGLQRLRAPGLRFH